MSYIKIGIIKKPHGLKGEVSVLPLTDDTARFKSLKSVFILVKDQYEKIDLESIRFKKDGLILKFFSYDKIEAVVGFKNSYIYINRNEAVKLSKDEYFTEDLIDSQVIYNDANYGKVTGVENFGSCDVLSVVFENRHIYYPMIKDYIQNINTEKKEIIISQIEGFFD